MENFLAEILGPNLRAARKAAGLTSTVCAQKVGVSQPAWNMWEMGVRLPKIELLVSICSLLHTTPNELLGFAPLRASAPPREINAGANSPVAVVNGNNNKISQVVNPQKRKARR